MVTVPPRTSQFLNINSADFPDQGNPTAVIGPSGDLFGSAFDGVGDYKLSIFKPLVSVSPIDQNTFSFYIKKDNTTTDGNLVTINDGATQATRALQTFIGASGELVVRFCSGTGSAESSIATGMLDWDDKEWRRITGRSLGNDIDVFVGGIEATAYFSQNVIGSGGFTGFPATTTTLTLNANSDGSFAQGVVSLAELDFWDGTRLTDEEILEAHAPAPTDEVFSQRIFDPIYNG